MWHVFVAYALSAILLFIGIETVMILLFGILNIMSHGDMSGIFNMEMVTYEALRTLKISVLLSIIVVGYSIIPIQKGN